MKNVFQKAVCALMLAVVSQAYAGVAFDDSLVLSGKRVININCIVRVNQIEVARNDNRGSDEAELHDVESADIFRKAVADAIPEAKVTWVMSWLALQDMRENYVALRKRIVEFHEKYGDEITFIPGAYFSPMFNSREQVRRDLHEGLELVSKMVGGGYRPRSIVGGYLAADSMRYLAEKENIHVAQGTIWSQYGIDKGDGDGSICYPYYPSCEHFCKPAQGKEDFIDCVNLDGWTCDFLCARRYGHADGGNSRLGVGPIEAYRRLGAERGLAESLAVVRTHFGEPNFSHNGFGWTIVNWELSLVKHYPPWVTECLTRWLKGIRDEFQDAIAPLMSEFGEAWRRENPDNSRIDYRFVQRGTGVSDWRYENGACRWHFEIPNGATALVTTKDGSREYSAGVYELEIDREKTPALADLALEFGAPAAKYGVNCWWWWLNGNTDKETITKDLEAMKDKHFQGASIFDAGGWAHLQHFDTIPPGPKFGSTHWLELFRHALDEAERLGLEIGTSIQSGWNLGGPRVPPELAAKKLVYTECIVNGGGSAIRLAQPETNKGFYRDIAILAFPIDDDRIADEPVQFLDGKTLSTVHHAQWDARYLLDNEKKDGRATHKTPYIVNRESILDLTSRMHAGGLLDWTAPAGKWAILRIGFTCTTIKISTASATWDGNVIDHLSKDAFDAYWSTEVVPLLSAAGRHAGKTLKYMQTDSWECGAMNWTQGFDKMFIEWMGYDPRPFLVAAAGYVVDGMATTHAFLADWRKAVGRAVCENHYARFAEKAHEYGIGINPESAGPNPMIFDGMKNYGKSDIMMSEFWLPDPPRTVVRYFVKQAASAAHVYGRRIVGAESFTSIGPQWNDLLWKSQKRAFDHEVVSGLNRVYLHTFTSSPDSMGEPGQEYFAGTHFNRHVTWWDCSDGFFDYIRRVQSLAQNGAFVADAIYYYGDHVPNVYHTQETDMGRVLPGFDYDVADEDTLMRLSVDDKGFIVLPHGPCYRVLILPDHGVLSLAAIKKIQTLVDAGATVVGECPLRLVSLVGGDAAQQEFRKIANDLRGHIVTGKTAHEFLLECGVAPDFAAEGTNGLDAIHYRFADGDAYFVRNSENKSVIAQCRFRIAGRSPECWNPLTGERVALSVFTQDGETTELELPFDPYGTCFVVFRKSCVCGMRTGESNFRGRSLIATLDGSWHVSFGNGVNATFGELEDWSRNDDERIRFFSGKATYSKNFDFSKERNREYFIELGEVLDVGIASVRLNGKNLGTVWTKPFRVDATTALVDGANFIEIEIVNSWHNRVKGDQMHPDKSSGTRTNINMMRHGNKTLSSSGLMGPVRIYAIKEN